MKFWRKLHKWVAMVIGIQILAWISGGVLMSVIPIDMVRGKHLIAKPPEPKSENIIVPLYQPDLAKWQSIQWIMREANRVLKMTAFDGSSVYIDPNSGSELGDLTPLQARTLAQVRYLGEGNIKSVNLLSEIPQEVSFLSFPLYQVQFDDWINTSFYIAADSGEIKSVRSDLWRIYDFFWMLHIMDYQERENFNNPLLIATAISALAFMMSGFVLLYFSILKPQFKKSRYHLSRQRAK